MIILIINKMREIITTLNPHLLPNTHLVKISVDNDNKPTKKNRFIKLEVL